MEIEGYIPIDKAVKWLQNEVYPGYDCMCLYFDSKNECIEKFIKDMQNPNYGKTSTDLRDDEW